MLHPLVIASLALLVLNDHVLKVRHPSLVTGKLSDVAGLMLFPIVVVSAIEIVARRPRGTFRRLVVPVAVATGMVFAAVQLTEVGAHFYTTAWGTMRAVQPWSKTSGVALLTQDAGDLLALPMLVVSAWVYRRPMPGDRDRARFTDDEA